MGRAEAVVAAPDVVRRLADIDDETFVDAWRQARFEVASVARDLGVSRAAVYRRVRNTPACRLASDVPLGELLAALDSCRGDLAGTARQLAVSRRGLATRLRASGVALQEGSPPDVDRP